jgi:two-component system CheB/CheR fusion protein
VRTLGGAFHPADEHGLPLPLNMTPQMRAARGETFTFDFTETATDDTARWFEATGRPLDAINAGEGLVVIRDISDRSIRQRQDEFLAWAAHELRTPLTLFKGYLQMAVQRIGPDGDARLLHYLDRAAHQVRQQMLLVEDLLDATRLETGKLTLRTETVDLTVLTTHVVEVIQILAQRQVITLDVDDGTYVVEADGSRLEQVLLNLLTNAIAYAPGTDQITVALRRDGDEAEVTVRDFGPGIAPATLKVLFRRFAQGSVEESAGTRGLGLGLFIARKIVQAHGGTLTVMSVLGEGTTFTIRLPLKPGTMSVSSGTAENRQINTDLVE